MQTVDSRAAEKKIPLKTGHLSLKNKNSKNTIHNALQIRHKYFYSYPSKCCRQLWWNSANPWEFFPIHAGIGAITKLESCSHSRWESRSHRESHSHGHLYSLARELRQVQVGALSCCQ